MNQIQEYWIVFHKTHTFMRHFLKKDFGHCFVITRDQFNWIMLDARQNKLKFEIPSFRIDSDLPRLMIRNGNRVIKVQMEENHKKWFMKLGFYNCVNFVKYTIGLKAFSITPYQLYKKLIKIKKCNYHHYNIQSISFLI